MPDAPPAPSPEPSAPGTDLAAAATAVDQAAARVRDTLARAADAASGEAADILAVTAAMAADPSLADEARRRVAGDPVHARAGRVGRGRAGRGAAPGAGRDVRRPGA